MNKVFRFALRRDMFRFALLCALGLGLGLAANRLRAKPLPLQYYTPKERHIRCGC